MESRKTDRLNYVLRARPLKRADYIKLQKSIYRKERIAYNKLHSFVNRITLGMRRRVIILRFGSVGSSVIRDSGKKDWVKRICCSVGLKKASVYNIVKAYVKNGYQVLQPPARKGGMKSPLNQEQIDFCLNNETIRLWTLLTLIQRIQQLKLKFDSQGKSTQNIQNMAKRVI